MRSRLENALSRHVRRFLVILVIFLINLHVYFWILRKPHAFSPNLYGPGSEYGSPAKPIGRVFIASNHWNTAQAIHDFWGQALLALVRVLGVQNVHVSIYENGSWDSTKDQLRWLDKELESLGVERTIIMEENSHSEQINNRPSEQKPGWVFSKKQGQFELRRIPVLAELRNKALEPLEALQSKGKGNFNRVLFLNDVVFSTEDAINLLRTREGNYSTACAIDFQKRDKFYDTFALRDSRGRETASLRFPFFGHGASRSAILEQAPVPVKSCWNGIGIPLLYKSIRKCGANLNHLVAFDATPFQRSTSPLRFRGTADSLASLHLDASECCLIHADNSQTNNNRHGVWLNPLVRVGYNIDAYKYQRKYMYGWYEWVIGVTVRMGTNLFGLPWQNKVIGARMDDWAKGDAGGERREEPGEWCLVDEMHVMVSNGWRHD